MLTPLNVCRETPKNGVRLVSIPLLAVGIEHDFDRIGISQRGEKDLSKVSPQLFQLPLLRSIAGHGGDL
jgi:hypothetical protein